MTNIKMLDSGLPVKLEWLRSFIAVAGLRGFSKAARHLHLSQPAVSTRLKELEANVGTELVEKFGGRVRLSRSGEAAIGEARAILEGVRRFRTPERSRGIDVGGSYHRSPPPPHKRRGGGRGAVHRGGTGRSRTPRI